MSFTRCIMPLDKTDKRLTLSAAGTAGLGGLIYGLSVCLERGSRELKRICDVKGPKELKVFLENAKQGARLAVTGQVYSDEPLTTKIGRHSAVATRVMHVEMICTRTDAGLRPGERPISSINKDSPMFLQWPDCKVHLKPSDLKDLVPIMEQSGTLSQKPKLDILRSITEGYVSNTFVERKEEREYFVPLGSQITAIGEVRNQGMENAMGSHKEVSLVPHKGHMQFSRLTLQQQIEKLDWWSSSFRSAARGCLYVSTAFMCGFLTYKAIKAWKRRKERIKEKEYLKAAHASREARRAANSNSTPTRQLPEEGTSQAEAPWHCIVCWNEGEGVSQAVFPACGHVAVCEECSKHLTQCPVCRTRSNPRRLYYS